MSATVPISTVIKDNPCINKMVIGLGNPGTRFANTRHNIGWSAVESFVGKKKGTDIKSTFDCVDNIANYCVLGINDLQVLFVLPLTYMNRSGIAAAYFIERFCLDSKNILVIVDEYNFPLGRLHLKKIKSDCGHNGLASLMSCIDNNDFNILRCGIGNNFGYGELVDYVLSTFGSDEITARDEMLESCCSAIDIFLSNEISVAMSLINSTYR